MRSNDRYNASIPTYYYALLHRKSDIMHAYNAYSMDICERIDAG
jgi:hypothetical protein